MATESSTPSGGGSLDLLASLTDHLRPTPNPLGKNQFTECPAKDDPDFLNILSELHKTCISARRASHILEKTHGIIVSNRTISRRWREMGLTASGKTEASLPVSQITRLVAAQMAMDPAAQMGKNLTKHRIALQTGYHLKRETIGQIQRMLDPEGSAMRHPSSRRIKRSPLTSAGPNEVWCCDGHDKLCKYGFAIWGLRDKFSRKWLGLWVLPNNRISHVVAYLWLTVVWEVGGMPLQTSSDCGGENRLIYGLANALRETVTSAAENGNEKPAHIFLRSVHHIPIERGWLDLRKSFGHNFIHFWGEGSTTYNDQNPLHQLLVRWLWPPLIQRELDKFRVQENSRRVRKQRAKALPSGTSPNIAYDLPEEFGGRNCLQPIDPEFIQEILNEMQPQKDALSDWEIPDEFDKRAKTALRCCGIREVTFNNVWLAFNAMLNLL